MRLAIAALLFPTLLPAQFAGLAVTGNGAKLYFSSSSRLQGSQLPFHGKIYSIQEGGPRLHAFRSLEPPPRYPSPPGGIYPPTADYSNYYRLLSAGVSRDGGVVWFVGQRDCTGRACRATQSTLYETTVFGVPGRGELRLVGSATISGNGRYAFTYDWDGERRATPTLTDLFTGAVYYFPSASATYGPPLPGAVADDGTVVVSTKDAVNLLRSTGIESLARGLGGMSPILDAAGKTMLYETVAYQGYGLNPPRVPPRVLRIHQVGSQSDRALVEAPGEFFGRGFVAGDRQVYFLSNAQFGTGKPPGLIQIYLINVDGTGFRQLSHEPFGVSEAVVSADGSTAWYVSNSGRLLKLDIASGRLTEGIARTPSITGFHGYVVPGSLATILGHGLAADTMSAEPPLPRELGGVRLTLDGAPVPLARVSPVEVIYQVPWEANPIPPREVELRAAPGFDSVFEPPPLSMPVHYVFSSPNFVDLPADDSWPVGGESYSLAVHESWDALVTPQRPARPGEVVHVYATGLGRVDEPPPTGEAATTDRLIRLSFAPSCYASTDTPGSLQLPVLFAGLAPGTLGYYLISIRIPSLSPRNSLGFHCFTPQPAYGRLPYRQ